MHLSIILIGVYGLIVFAGGLMGFVKAGSKPSLIAGTVSAAVLALAFWMGEGRGNGVEGLWIAAGVAALLSIVFLMRFLKTHSFMPSGMMLIISVAAAGYFAYTAHWPL